MGWRWDDAGLDPVGLKDENAFSFPWGAHPEILLCGSYFGKTTNEVSAWPCDFLHFELLLTLHFLVYSATGAIAVFSGFFKV